MISYVRREAAKNAVLLKDSLIQFDLDVYLVSFGFHCFGNYYYFFRNTTFRMYTRFKWEATGKIH